MSEIYENSTGLYIVLLPIYNYQELQNTYEMKTKVLKRIMNKT